MKNIIKLTGVATALLFAVGCSEEFLDKQPSEFLTQDQVADAASNNPEVIAGSIAGIYTLQFESGSGGTGGHDDFGQKAYDIYGDMLSGDVALSVSSFGWYRSNITEFQATQDFTNLDNYQAWRYYYRIIRSANLVIDALGGNDAVPEIDANKYLLGQAKAMRAHSYFYLTQYYTKSYNPSAEILPIYTTSSDQNGPKVAASEIFTLIEKDLNDAISLLDGFARSAKNEVNKPVAQGILAYVLAFKGDDWESVMDLTGAAIDEGGFRLMDRDEVVGGFNDANTPGWMWGVDLTTDSGVGLLSWWGQMDYFSYSYAGYGDYKAMDSGLYAQISDDDIRKTQFNTNTASSNYLQPWFKFYEPAKQPRGTSTTIVSDLIYMRVAEMYLLHAEAAANLGMDGAAVGALKTVLDERVDDTSYLTGLGGTALKDEIYLQTRIELWGEGKSYLALKRNKKSILRGDNHLSFVGVSIPYNDERLTFKIPESEILYNPFVSTQND